MNPELEKKFLQLIREVIRENITDIHLRSGKVPFIRMMSRDVEPVTPFGAITVEDLFALVAYNGSSGYAG